MFKFFRKRSPRKVLKIELNQQLVIAVVHHFESHVFRHSLRLMRCNELTVNLSSFFFCCCCCSHQIVCLLGDDSILTLTHTKELNHQASAQMLCVLAVCPRKLFDHPALLPDQQKKKPRSDDDYPDDTVLARSEGSQKKKYFALHLELDNAMVINNAKSRPERYKSNY